MLLPQMSQMSWVYHTLLALGASLHINTSPPVEMSGLKRPFNYKVNFKCMVPKRTPGLRYEVCEYDSSK